MQTSKCPLCHSDVVIDDEACKGDLVDCLNCGVELEITSLQPAKLSELKEENE